jgi:putative spermidine/putrescine transport system permease protein
VVCGAVCAASHGDFAGSFLRSILLAVLVLGITVVLSVIAGLAFRRRFVGATLVFYLAIASLISGTLVGLGIGLMCSGYNRPGTRRHWGRN